MRFLSFITFEFAFLVVTVKTAWDGGQEIAQDTFFLWSHSKKKFFSTQQSIFISKARQWYNLAWKVNCCHLQVIQALSLSLELVSTMLDTNGMQRC